MFLFVLVPASEQAFTPGANHFVEEDQDMDFCVHHRAVRK